MRVTKEGDLYVCTCQPNESHAPRNAGFNWSGKLIGTWTTKSPTVAARMAEHADPAIQGDLGALSAVQGITYNMSLSSIPSKTMSIPSLPGLDYLGYQLAGVEYMGLAHNAMIADEMGLGKTIEVIAYINKHEIQNVLIVCPAQLKLNWLFELDKWLIDRSTTKSVAYHDRVVPTTNMVIINYDIIHKFLPQILRRDWDMIVGDEAFAIKNPSSRRTKAFMKLEADRRFLLNGTPILNRPEELWTQLKWLDRDTWGDWYFFMSRYCSLKHGRHGFDTSGHCNLGELNQRLRESVMIRRLKRDVLKDLPPKFRQVLEFPCNDHELLRAEIEAWELIENMRGHIGKLEADALATPDDKEHRGEMMKLQKGMGAAFGELAKLRHKVAMIKLPMIVQHLKHVTPVKKVVCFAHHREVVAELNKTFGLKAVMLVGGMSERQKNQSVEAFQRNPDVRLFLGSIHASGTGITLTASDHAVFAEQDWTPSAIQQCEDRLHRVGQKQNVLIQHLVLEGSLDARMAHLCVNKQSVIDDALGDFV